MSIHVYVCVCVFICTQSTTQSATVLFESICKLTTCFSGAIIHPNEGTPKLMSTLSKFAAYKAPLSASWGRILIHKLTPKIKWQQLFLGMRPPRKRKFLKKNLFIRTMTIFQRVQQILLLSAHSYPDTVYKYIHRDHI